MRDDGKLLHYISKAERRSGMLRGRGDGKLPPEGVRDGFDRGLSTPRIVLPPSVERRRETHPRADD